MKTLLVIDVQNDFCPGGSLAVSEGDAIIPVINNMVAEFWANGDLVIYTKDYHPPDHHSFKTNHAEGVWPPHCVQGTDGVEFHHDLSVKGTIFFKGFLTDKDSYSGFGGHLELNQDSPSLESHLKSKGVAEVVVVGLALDYCVKATAIDAHKLGFKTSVVLAGTKAVNVNVGDDAKAITEMRDLGIEII